MAQSKNEKSKSGIKVEQVGSPNKPVAPQGNDPELESTPNKELFDLQKEAVSLGMPQEDAEKFEDVATLTATINTLKAMKASQSVPNVEVANPREDAKIEKQWRSKAQRMKDYLESQPQVSIIIPCEAKEKPGTFIVREDGQKVYAGAWWSKTFNGYRVDVPKGVYTRVAQDVAENISNEFNQVQMDLEKLGLDRIDPKTGKPVADRLS